VIFLGKGYKVGKSLLLMTRGISYDIECQGSCMHVVGATFLPRVGDMVHLNVEQEGTRVYECRVAEVYHFLKKGRSGGVAEKGLPLVTLSVEK
jgi:hypothetical protein